ncbi:MAG: uroporphyrinogen decarboxylase family protein [Thermincola sp.]|nr:uroporphyrinogen decarboxylase family protein [Thermincola sp.]MDT3701941.1 uroporphyrinogen decarboxylase family protein [Thermincola sp.]
MKYDSMTSQERMQALMKGERPDRVPCIPFIVGHAAVVCGKPIAKVYDSAEESFMYQLHTKNLYGHDGNPNYAYADAGGWEFGGDIEFPYKQYAGAPNVIRVPVETEEDALNLEVPSVILKAGSVPIMLEFARLQAKFGMPATVRIGSSFSWASSIMGTDRMLRWMIKKPELVHRILEKVNQFILDMVKYWINEFGAEKIIAHDGGPVADNRLISPKQFEIFVLPYLKEVHEKVTEMGIPTIISHICGEHNKNLKYWQQVPYGKKGILSFGPEVSLKKASEMFPDHVIAGNVDPVVIQEGTPTQVLELCRRAIEEGKDHPGGYILMAGCEVPPAAPPVNVSMMVKAVQEYGGY